MNLDERPPAITISSILSARPEDFQLATVQRSPAWQSEHMARLLDSLLRKYPTGSLLFARAGGVHTYLLGEWAEGAGRKARPPSDDWFLLDGQQRVLAIRTLFGAQGNTEFYVKMTGELPPLSIRTRRQKDRHLRDFIWWLESQSSPVRRPDIGLPVDRAKWLCLRAVSRHLEVLDGARVMGVSDQLQALSRVDPDFALEQLSTKERTQSEENADRIFSLLFTRAIPVEYTEPKKALDVLGVYSRLNLEGIPVKQEDVFFAAVKTAWPQAEEKLLPLCERLKGLVDHHILLRTLARMASLEDERGVDPLPLQADSLNDKRGDEILLRLKRYVEDAAVSARWSDWAETLVQMSHLGNALRWVNQYAWDPVLLYVAKSRSTPLDDTNIKATVRFLIGTTVFNYNASFRYKFWRPAFSAVHQHCHGAFPEEQITDCIRSIEAGARPLASSASVESRVRRAAEHYPLLLSIVQGIPFGRNSKRPFEWDHIYPRALSNKYMRVKQAGRGLGRLADHSRLVNSAGNLAAVPEELNVEAGDEAPREKLGIYGCPENAGKWDFCAGTSVLEKMFLIPEEAEKVSRLCERLKAVHETSGIDERNRELDNAMMEFKVYAEGRSERIWERVDGLYGIRAYAGEAVGHGG